MKNENSKIQKPKTKNQDTNSIRQLADKFLHPTSHIQNSQPKESLRGTHYLARQMERGQNGSSRGFTQIYLCIFVFNLSHLWFLSLSLKYLFIWATFSQRFPFGLGRSANGKRTKRIITRIYADLFVLFCV